MAPSESRLADAYAQPDHGPRQRGLRDPHLLRGTGDVLGAGDPGEVGEPGREQPRDLLTGPLCHDFCVTGR